MTAGGPVFRAESEVPRAYVIGFLFTIERDRVLLVRKNRPEWQAGRLNGIGGKIEPGELAIDAMIREFKEETGLLVRGWLPFYRERFANGIDLQFFAASADEFDQARTMTDEEILGVGVNLAVTGVPVVPKLSFLLPMALHFMTEPVGNIPVLDAAPPAPQPEKGAP
jgi:8-oxo-dGTP diphosphatase